MFFACKVGGEQYELPTLTLGEARTLKKQFGMEDLKEFSITDPDVLVGLLFLCLKRTRPGVPDVALLAEIERMDIETVEEADTAEVDPTPAAPVAAGTKGGKKATSRKTTGSPS